MILICLVNLEEADELTKIALASKRPWGYPEHWIEIWTPQLTFNPGYFQANESWAADVGGRPVAFYTLLDQHGTAWIENLWVAPEFIGRGIGRALFLHAIKRSRQRGFGVLRLAADPNAAAFYEKMGMRKVSERHSELDGLPRVLPLMEIEL